MEVIGISFTALMFCMIGIAIIGTIGGVLLLLIKLGVIVQKVSEPPHIDHGNYSMDAGKEVRAERDR